MNAKNQRLEQMHIKHSKALALNLNKNVLKEQEFSFGKQRKWFRTKYTFSRNQLNNLIASTLVGLVIGVFLTQGVKGGVFGAILGMMFIFPLLDN